MSKEKLIEFFNFDDYINKHPKNEPYVILTGQESFQPAGYERMALYSQYVRYGSYMVPIDSKNRALNEIDHHSAFPSEGGYFESNEDGTTVYNLYESWEYNEGLTVESVVLDRFWEGLGIQFYEPSQRVVLYLRLLNKNDDWIDPYTEEVVIKRVRMNEQLDGVLHSINRIEIKIDYLKDYLAARKSGLFIARYCSRGMIFQSADQIPQLNQSKEVTHGKWSYYGNDDPKYQKELWAQADLRQKFWIDPFPKPRREDADPQTSEFVGGVFFIVEDGTKKEFDVMAGHQGDYFKLISFNPRVMEIFLNRHGFGYREYSRETMGLKFPNGEEIHVGINPSGQIQVWWGQLAKHSKRYQELLAPYSEPWVEKIPDNHDYVRTTIKAEFPVTKPLRENLNKLKTEINDYFETKFQEVFFNADSDAKDLVRVFEPYERDPYQLLDIMELIDKWLISEKRPDRIIEYYNLEDLISEKNEKKNFKSLVSLELLLTKYFDENTAKEKITILRQIKDLRICKAHYKNLTEILKKYGLQDMQMRDIYINAIDDLENFLEWLAQQCEQDVFQ